MERRRGQAWLDLAGLRREEIFKWLARARGTVEVSYQGVGFQEGLSRERRS